MPKMHSRIVTDVSLQCRPCGQLWVETPVERPWTAHVFTCPDCAGHDIAILAERSRQVLAE